MAMDPQLEEALRQVHNALTNKRGRGPLLSHWRMQKIAALLQESNMGPPRQEWPTSPRSPHAPRRYSGPHGDYEHYCARCRATFSDRRSLADHILNMHEKLVSDSRPSLEHRDPIVCQYCQLELNEPINKHIKSQHPNACNECKVDFENKRAQAEHNITTHDHQFVCKYNECYTTFRIEEGLRQHRLAKEHLYRCDKCPDRHPFADEAACEQHMRVKHAGSISGGSSSSHSPSPGPGPMPMMSRAPHPPHHHQTTHNGTGSGARSPTRIPIRANTAPTAASIWGAGLDLDLVNNTTPSGGDDYWSALNSWAQA